MPYYDNRAVRPSVPLPLDDYDDLDEDDNIDQLELTQPPRAPYRVAGGSIAPGSTRPSLTTAGSLPPVRRPLPPPARDTAAGRRPNIPATPVPAARNARVIVPANRKFSGWLLAGGIALVVLVVSYLVVSALVGVWQNWQDDQTYGWPRMTRLEAKVGHNDAAPNAKTLFIAQNLKGQVTIIEIPGGDPTQTRVIVGPQLFGKNRELVPIRLTIEDVNGDGQLDLIATVQEQKLIYINEKGNFRPITEPERAKLRADN